MQYYNLRNIGSDLDIVISKRDKLELLKKGYTLNLFGGKTEKDVDSTFTNFENKNIDLVITLNQYDYEFFKSGSIFYKNRKDLLVISLEKLLLTKVFASYYSGGKHTKDIDLIINGIEKKQYKTNFITK